MRPQVLEGWLEGVPSQSLARCDAKFPGAYLTQAVQSSRFPVPLVAGEKALLRVFVTAGRANNDEHSPAPGHRFTWTAGGFTSSTFRANPGPCQLISTKDRWRSLTTPLFRRKSCNRDWKW